MDPAKKYLSSLNTEVNETAYKSTQFQQL